MATYFTINDFPAALLFRIKSTVSAHNTAAV